MSFKQRRDGAPGIPLINQQNPFDTPAGWLENDNGPDLIVANYQGGERMPKICKYPDETAHIGVGDPLNHAIYLSLIVN
jgi:hypothetical protein